ncbi:MAG: hypothetical protein GYA23_12450 [Methanomicrobiales archaeon]|nr:hypothetical protein [Methanomicrobiales archaeon]
MANKFLFGLVFCLLLVAGVLFAGCSDESSDAVTTPVPTTAPVAKYSAGDIIAKTESGGETMLYVITKYDSATDEYERAWIYKNDDGTWGHFIDSRTDRSTRKIIEKVYPVKIAHVTVSAIPITTPSLVTVVPTTPSGNAPTVTSISPTSGAKDATVAVTITGTNFQSGGTPKLLLPGSPALAGTGVSISSTKIDCTFNLYGKDIGKYHVIVTNPDGQSGMLNSAFSIGDAAPIITSVSPSSFEINETGGLVINGQNFKEGVKVTLLQGTSEITCVSPVVTSGSRISCDIDFNSKRYPQVKFGDWDVRVLNIEGSQSGILTKKFVIKNSSSLSDE